MAYIYFTLIIIAIFNKKEKKEEGKDSTRLGHFSEIKFVDYSPMKIKKKFICIDSFTRFIIYNIYSYKCWQ